MKKPLLKRFAGWMRRAGTKSRRFGPFHVMRVIHDGAKATVYEGRSPGDETTVAIKGYKAGFNRTARRMRRRYRLRSEGEIGMLLNPGDDDDADAWPIVRTLDYGHEFGDAAKPYYVVLEYVEGMNAKHLLGCRDPLLRERRMEIARTVGEALCLIHERGFLHRDICMDNVMLARAGRITLLDLGFVAPSGLAFRERSGTPSYMAPEQFQGEPLYQTADVYAFGVLLFELFTQRLPFTSPLPSHKEELAHRRAADLRTQHLHDDPPRPSELVDDLPEGLEYVILKCLAKKPSGRYPNIRMVLAALEKMSDTPC
jgi:serine/threonine-protein kinase